MNSTADNHPKAGFLLAFVVLSSFSVVLGVIGNLLVIVYHIFFNANKNATNRLVVNLAISDFLVCSAFFPTYSVEYVRISKGATRDDTTFCRVSLMVAGASMAWSMLNLMALTIDRFLSITVPLKYPVIATWRRTCLVLMVIWAAGFLNGISLYFTAKPTGVDLVCEVNTIVAIAGATVCFYIPLIVTVVFNWKILKIARAQRRKIHTQTPSMSSTTTFTESRRNFAKQFKLYKTFSLIFGCFLFCMTPLPILAVVDTVICSKSCIPAETVVVFGFLAGFNSVLNAFIYGIRHEEYRRAFRVLVLQPCGT